MSYINISAEKPIQDHYGDKYDQCYGCGPHNSDGLQLKSYWDGEKATANFVPAKKHNGIDGFVYGGLVASLVDCHAMATAAANLVNNTKQIAALPRFVTGTLTVKYIKPTPLSGSSIELSAKVTEQAERRSTVHVKVSVDGTVTAEGEVIAFHIPETME